jgi:acyl-coenzyme A thioesterase PaaI-like protein
MNLNFLSAAPAGDVIAEARLLRLGNRHAVMELALYTGDSRTMVAHVTGTYALPRSRAA